MGQSKLNSRAAPNPIYLVSFTRAWIRRGTVQPRPGGSASLATAPAVSCGNEDRLIVSDAGSDCRYDGGPLGTCRGVPTFDVKAGTRRTMPDSPRCIGIAADHGVYASKDFSR